jgi:hypothetical protein
MEGEEMLEMGRRRGHSGVRMVVLVVVEYDMAKVIPRVVGEVILGKARPRKEEGKQRHPHHRILLVHPQRNILENTYIEDLRHGHW